MGAPVKTDAALLIKAVVQAGKDKAAMVQAVAVKVDKVLEWAAVTDMVLVATALADKVRAVMVPAVAVKVDKVLEWAAVMVPVDPAARVVQAVPVARELQVADKVAAQAHPLLLHKAVAQAHPAVRVALLHKVEVKVAARMDPIQNLDD